MSKALHLGKEAFGEHHVVHQWAEMTHMAAVQMLALHLRGGNFRRASSMHWWEWREESQDSAAALYPLRRQACTPH